MHVTGCSPHTGFCTCYAVAGVTLSYPNPIRPSAPPHVGRVVAIRQGGSGLLVLLEGKKVYVPAAKCTEVR